MNISSNLTWTNHIQKVSASGNRTLGFCKRNIRSKNPAIRSTAYKALVRPVLKYSSTVWSPHAKSGIDKLERVQRRAARWVSNDYSYQSSVTTMLNNLKWRSLQHRRDDARLVLFYKIIHGLVAFPMPPYIIHPLKQTRLSHPLAYRQIHTSVDYYKFSYFQLAIWQWNHLPASIVMLPTLSAFKLAVCNVSHKMP